MQEEKSVDAREIWAYAFSFPSSRDCSLGEPMDSYTARRIHEIILAAKKPLLISDERIDGDSLGSSLAILDYLKRLGRSPQVYVCEAVPEKYRFLPHAELCTTDKTVFDDPDVDLVISFDCSDGAYIRGLTSKLPGRPTVVNIDHHATNLRYGDVNLVIVGSPATAEVVYQFFVVNGIEPGKDAAICLLAGLCFDTTIFSNSGTDERAFRAASDLLMRGARIQDVIRALFRNRSVALLRLWGTALERLTLHPIHGFIATFITRADMTEHNVTDDEVEGLSNFLGLVTEAHTIIVMKEGPNKDVKVSMRSQRHDVSAIAKSFGGGGHVKAAGFTFPNASLEEKNAAWYLARDQKVELAMEMIASSLK